MMKETDLDYGSFDSPNDKTKNNSELQLEKNIDIINSHFKKSSEKKEESVQKNIPDESVSIVATIEPEDAVTIDVSEKKSQTQNVSGKKIKRTYIGAKLISIISTLVIISMGLITVLVSFYVTKDTRANAETTNFTLNARTASDAENRINSVISNVAMFCDFFDDEEKSDDELAYDAVKFFDRNSDIVSIGFLTREKVYTNSAFFITNDIPPTLVKAYIDSEKESIEKAKNGFTTIENASPFFMIPCAAIFYPQMINNKTEIVIAIFSTDKLSESISTGRINETFLINDSGVVLIHPDSQVMMMAADLSSNKFVSMVIEKNTSGMQQSYIDDSGNEYFAACQKITAANCRVITQVKTSVILAAINATTRRNIALTIAILSIAILVIWFFAKSISVPLARLTQVTDEINKGNFNTRLFEKLNDKRTDEIGVLNRSTKAEQDILNTVTSLTNKGVTKAIVKKEIDFEPHLKDITVFFSDIRGFTSISDGFEKRFGKQSACEIINFLNDYMSRMVNCISITGGVVDKFEGDAIMAAWGVLRDDDLDYELLDDQNPEKQKLKEIHYQHYVSDAVSAIKSTVAMRYALMKYNKDADLFSKAHNDEPLSQYKPHLKIGCGLNSGRVTVGFMGSNEKMEFTSIGDAVNLASRTESSNKLCGTDILIAEDTYNLLKKDFIRCKENDYQIKAENLENEIIAEMIPVSFSVKGKSAQHFYGIVNMPNFDIKKFFATSESDFKVDPDCEVAVGPKGPKNLSQVRKLLDIPEPDFTGVNLDEQENKISIN